MSSESPDEAGKNNTEENEILSSDVEFDSIQIKESSETVSNTAAAKDPQINALIDQGATPLSLPESGRTVTFESEKIHHSDVSPIINELKDSKLIFENLDSIEDVLPSSNKSTATADMEICKDSSASSPKDAELEALLQESVSSNEKESKPSSSTERSELFLKSLRAFFDESVPSTSGNSSCDNAKGESSGNKRSVDQRDETVELFTADMEDSSDEDAGKRQRLNEENVEEDDEMVSDVDIEEYDDSSEHYGDTWSDNSSDRASSDGSAGIFGNAFHFHQRSISDDCDDDNYQLSDSTEDSEDEDDKNSAAIMQKATKKWSWSAIRELHNRELGLNPKFNEKYYRSLHNVASLKLSCELEGHNGCVNTVEFNEKGTLLVSGSDDLKVIVWNWTSKKKLESFKTGHRENVLQAEWLPTKDDRWIVTSSRDGRVRLLDVMTGKHRRIARHMNACNKIATHVETPSVILSVGEDGRILSIDLRDESPKKLLCLKDESGQMPVRLFSIHSNPLDSNQFCVAGDMKKVHIYDKRKCRMPLSKMYPSTTLSTHLSDPKVTCAVYNYNGTEIVASYDDNNIYLFDTNPSAKEGTFVHCYKGHRNFLTFKEVNFYGPKSEYIVSGSDCRNIFMWEKESEAIVQWMVGDNEGSINSLAIHPEYPAMATSGFDHNVKVWLPSALPSRIDKNKLKRCIKINRENKTLPIDDTNIWNLLRNLHRNFVATLLNSNSSHD